jgi:hypothetical protein
MSECKGIYDGVTPYVFCSKIDTRKKDMDECQWASSECTLVSVTGHDPLVPYNCRFFKCGWIKKCPAEGWHLWELRALRGNKV